MRLIFTPLFFVLMITGTIAAAQTSRKTSSRKTTTKVAKKKAPVVKSTTPLKKEVATRVKITTDSGVIIVRLYDSTPLHRDNFVKLVKEGFYDSLLFHRVIPQFMIQGGDPGSKTAEPGTLLGNGGDNLPRIPAEIKTQYFHKRGVLAAARDGNPEKASSGCQFYLVQGKKLSPEEITMAEQRTGKKFTEAEKKIYSTEGGTPWLDGQYTVFGETESGFEVIDKIAGMARDNNNRPLTDIRMKIELVKP
jgi:peptidyl-prolyl cis-trans isomerase B (cyclophilin B)